MIILEQILDDIEDMKRRHLPEEDIRLHTDMLIAEWNKATVEYFRIQGIVKEALK